MDLLGYNKISVGPALQVLRALTEHISSLLIATSADVEREVRRLGAPGAEAQPTTIRQILKEQTEHLQDHIGDIRQALEQHVNQALSIESTA